MMAPIAANFSAGLFFGPKKGLGLKGVCPKSWDGGFRASVTQYDIPRIYNKDI